MPFHAAGPGRVPVEEGVVIVVMPLESRMPALCEELREELLN